MMVEIPDHLQIPAPPFTHLGINLFGPLEVRDDIRDKTTRYVQVYRKMWGVVVVCLGTHAVMLYLARGYSMEDFMFVWTRHTANWGVPLSIYMDRGTQLARAGQVICEEEASLDWAKFAANQGVT